MESMPFVIIFSEWNKSLLKFYFFICVYKTFTVFSHSLNIKQDRYLKFIETRKTTSLWVRNYSYSHNSSRNTYRSYHTYITDHTHINAYSLKHINVFKIGQLNDPSIFEELKGLVRVRWREKQRDLKKWKIFLFLRQASKDVRIFRFCCL